MKPDDDRIAMDRAEEAGHVQARLGGRPPTPPPVGRATQAPAAPPDPAAARRATLVAGLRLASACAALVCALALSLPAIRDAWRGGSAPPEHAAASPDRQVIRGDFSGFSLLADSVPPGAAVIVDGKERGRTPALLSLECIPGNDLVVEMKLDGHKEYRHVDRCKADAILKLNPVLEKR